jgi:hypothetical protein
VVEIPQPIPTSFVLEHAYPNPFNPTTTIRYQIPVPGLVEIVVFDMLGRQVAELAAGNYEPGYYSVQWNASSLASGVYVARMMVLDGAGNIAFRQTAKLLLAK